jgi:hypothetical protein
VLAEHIEGKGVNDAAYPEGKSSRPPKLWQSFGHPDLHQLRQIFRIFPAQAVCLHRQLHRQLANRLEKMAPGPFVVVGAASQQLLEILSKTASPLLRFPAH